METTIWIVIGILSPAFILWLCSKVNIAQKLGPVLLACLLGIILGQIDFIPKAQSEVKEYGLNISILIGLSILLFSFNIRDQYKIIKPGLKSAFIAIISLAILIVSGYFIFGQNIEESWKLSGLMVGIYTGGTPNLASLSTALDVEHEVFIWVHSVDAVASALYLLIVLYLANGLKNKNTNGNELSTGEPNENTPILHRVYAIAVGVLISGIASLGLFIGVENQIVVVILLLSTLGVAASFIPAIKRIKGSYSTSLYFILIFSVFIGSEVNLRNLADINLSLFIYIFVVLIGTFAVHMLWGRYANVGKDMLLVTSVAMICSPPFVPAVAIALGRKDLLPIGISVGIMGYLTGNYLGIGLAYLIQYFT